MNIPIEEFRAAALAMFGPGWQTRMAKWLRVNPRTVRRWASGEVVVPGYVLNLMHIPFGGVGPESIPEWLFGTALGTGEREWVIHARPPRFIAEIADADDLVGGFSYEIAQGDQFCRFLWLDPEPPRPVLHVLLDNADTERQALYRDLERD
jgi:hypothetical protein